MSRTCYGADNQPFSQRIQGPPTVEEAQSGFSKGWLMAALSELPLCGRQRVGPGGEQLPVPCPWTRVPVKRAEERLHH